MTKKPARQRGAQPRNNNARKHGGYAAVQTLRATSIADLIDNLLHRQGEILMYAQQAAQAGDLDTAIKAMNIYGQNASRLARMLGKNAQGDQNIEDTLRAALDAAQISLDQELKREREEK